MEDNHIKITAEYYWKQESKKFYFDNYYLFLNKLDYAFDDYLLSYFF